MPRLPAEPPPPFRELAPRRVEVRSGGNGWLVLFGLPFLLFGIYSVLIGAGAVPMRSDAESGRLGFLLMGFAFGAVGAVAGFGCRRTILDAEEGRLIREWSVLVPLRQEERRLSEFNAVTIKLKKDSDSADRYLVQLKAEAGQDAVICGSADFAEARAQAEFLALLLQLNLEDRSTDHAEVLSPEQAGESLLEGMRSGRVRLAPAAARPIVMRSEVSASRHEARFVLPEQRGAAVAIAVAAALPVAFGWWLIPIFMRPYRRRAAHTPPTVMDMALAAWPVLILGVVPLVGLMFAVLGAVRRRTEVTVSRDGIRVDKQGAWSRHVRLIPVEEILALDYSDADRQVDSALRDAGSKGAPLPSPGAATTLSLMRTLAPGKGIIVKSRHGLFTFGEGLGGDELRYLLFVMLRVLAGH